LIWPHFDGQFESGKGPGFEIMRKLLLGLAVVMFATPAFADVWVKGHYRSDGTWVPGYWKTDPNGTAEDNYSQYPNYNPHTGSLGGRPPAPPPPLKPFTPNRDYGTPPPFNRPDPRRTGPIVEVPKLNAPVPRLGDNEAPCKRTSIFDPACP
jgi:hypothetical protein